MPTRKSNYSNIISAEKIRKSLEYFDKPDSIDSHSESITSFKKEGLTNNIFFGLMVILGSIFALIYGYTDVFSDALLPFGGFLLLASPFIFIGGIFMVIRNLSRLAFFKKDKKRESLETICTKYYEMVFCTDISDFQTKEDHIREVCQYISPPVFERYLENGWIMFKEIQEVNDNNFGPLECITCRRKTENSQEYKETLPVPEEYIDINTLYVMCEHCDSIFCYKCICYAKHEHRKYLCPICCDATNGLEGLAERWNQTRQKIIGRDNEYLLYDVVVEKKKRKDPHVIDINVTLAGETHSGKPYPKIIFQNVALQIENNWFLLTPEPILINKE